MIIFGNRHNFGKILGHISQIKTSRTFVNLNSKFTRIFDRKLHFHNPRNIKVVIISFRTYLHLRERFFPTSWIAIYFPCFEYG